MKNLRPILFSTAMVQAILEGRKTQTRRVVKPQPISVNTETPMSVEQFKAKGKELEDMGLVDIIHGTGGHVFPKCPYGKVGDVLWVRETFSRIRFEDETSNYVFKADDDFYKDNVEDWQGWKPSIHMPFEAARIFLEITDVRVQRLQDITFIDAGFEGIEYLERGDLSGWKNYMNDYGTYASAMLSFVSLWKSINGEESWNSNPWVWVVEFKKINKPNNL